jgi:nicotinate-nucleotide--dimethylbenzimidazole phosphoribosyltransferase
MSLLEEALKSITPADKDAIEKSKKRIDNLTKPIGSMGTLEDIASKMAGITGKLYNEIYKKNIIIMCSDNGVCEEGVSACPQNLTRIVTNNYTRGITGVCTLAKYNNSDITVVDIGVKGEFNNPKIINRKINHGTKNMCKGAAMTKEEAVKAIEVGIEMVDNLVKQGYDLFGTGEMGIANTATSAAVMAAILDCPVDLVTGKGSGLTEEQFSTKKSVIKKALDINKPNKEDVLDVISKVGGFDIAGMCGSFIGAAKNKVPIVIDGFISYTAALCAYRLNKNVKDYIFPSHLSKEPGVEYAIKELGLEPMLNLNMRLGEGSGCPLAFNIIESALYSMNNMATFQQASIGGEFFVDIREEN